MRKSIGVLMLLSLVGLAGCATVPRLQPISDSGQWLPGKFIWRDLVTPTPYLSQKFYTALLGWKFEPVADSGYFVIQSAGEPIGGLVDANRLGRKPAPGARFCKSRRTSRAAGGRRWLRIPPVRCCGCSIRSRAIPRTARRG